MILLIRVFELALLFGSFAAVKHGASGWWYVGCAALALACEAVLMVRGALKS